MRKVFIEWYDPCSETDNEWTSLDEVEGEPAICQSLGFLIKETDTAMVVAGHKDHRDFCGEIVIPKGCIISVNDVLLTRG